LALIALLTLSQYAFGWDLGIDQALITDTTGDTPYPGRIPFIGSIHFVLFGIVIATLDLRVPFGDGRRIWPAQWIALAMILVSAAVLLAYTYDFTSLYRPIRSNPIALHGVILLILLPLGAMLARPDQGLIARVRASDAGGQLLRRVLPAVILVPPVLGWLRLQGQEAGLFGSDLGLAIFATANVVILSTVTWLAADHARKADLERRTAAGKLRGQLARLDLLNHITRAIGERQDLRSIFQVVVRSIEDHLPVDFSCVCLYESAAGELTVATVGARAEQVAHELAMPENARIPIDANGLSRCVQGALVYEPDIRSVPFPFPQRLARGGFASLVISPLRFESTVFGVLVTARREPHSFSSGDCEFLRQLSEHVGLASHQTQLYTALQRAYDDLRQSQQTLMQQDRLRALGQMASGIAHDINNALSPMALYTDSLLEREKGLSPQGREQLMTISRAIDDVAHTVARMRQFYKGREPQLQLTRIDLNKLVRETLELTRARWRDLMQERGLVIDLRTELAPSVPAILGAEAEVRDALTNLIFNALDAMPEGGGLTLRTWADETPPGQVIVEVTDTGTGMDEETRQRCLEPFFTTKGERGTGLGLAMVYGMAQRHSAELGIDSAPGKGTTVRLIFPVAAQGPAAAGVAAAPVKPSRRLRILIIDDDPLLLQSVRDSLESDGHLVAVADGGQAGIDQFLAARKRNEPFAVVVTDLGMPYVDGRKVAATLRAASPETPIIMLTGWGQRLLTEKEIPAHVDRVLAKPPKLRELRAALAELTA
ncbi:MAG TPA: ATP-binding protein, partial [Steroidobacteraceae bacterium]